MSQYFLYRAFEGNDDIVIFCVKEDEMGRFGYLVHMDHNRPTHTSISLELPELRDMYRTYKRMGWQDKATCECGQEYDAGWYIHIGQCPTCEAQAEMEAHEEWLMVRDCAKS